ncbi:hypothetical protein BT69DRAFT_1306554 [Atractiella rhizophila]|nr:hypothetical protein BT69DRAFT_1306554 [Atractiella rhizophila]
MLYELDVEANFQTTDGPGARRRKIRSDRGGEGGDRMQMMLLMELREVRKDNKEQRERERGMSEQGKGACHKEQKGTEGGLFRSMVEREDEVGEVREVERYSLMKAMEGWRDCSRPTITFYESGSKGQELEKRVTLDPSNPESQLVRQHISYALQVKSRFVALRDDYQNEPVLAQKLKDSFP